jgi:hypothetical protein
MSMKVGGKRKLLVPAHLAYGERSMGAITPNSDLQTFEIELLEVLTWDVLIIATPRTLGTGSSISGRGAAQCKVICSSTFSSLLS